MGYLKRKQETTVINDIAKLIQKLESYCAYQERCTSEITSKLLEYGADKPALEIVLEHLKENNFFDDTRYAFSFASGKQRLKKWGKEKISHELRLKKVDLAIIQKALAEIDESKYDIVLYNLLEKKYVALKRGNTENIKQKLINFALQKGYAYTDISKTLHTLNLQDG